MLFTNHDIFDRLSDFAPAASQSLQQDERYTIGGRIRKVWTAATGDGTGWQVLVGSQWRTDFINAFQAPTIAAAIPHNDLLFGRDARRGFAYRRVGPRHLDHDRRSVRCPACRRQLGHPYDREPTVADTIIDLFAVAAHDRRSLVKGLSMGVSRRSVK